MLKEIIEAQEGKAFGYTPLLTDDGGGLFQGDTPWSYNDYNQLGGQTNRLRSPLSQRQAHVHEQLYGGREPVDWIMDAVNYTAIAAASAGYHFETAGGVELAIKDDPKTPGTVELAPFMLIQLFQEPNPYMDWSDLFELTLIDWLLVGNAYWVKWQVNADNQPLALYRMAPEYVRIDPGEFGPVQYRYRLPGMQNEVVFQPDQVVHFKRPNPHSVYYGQGLVQGGARALDMELGLTNTMASYYERRAMPSGVVSTTRRVPRDVFNKLKSQMRSFYSGSRNAGELMVLEAGLTYTSVSPSAADSLFATMGGWSRDRILAMFNMNKSLIGIWEPGDNPEIAMWQLQFDQKTMMPICSRFQRAISRGLTRPGWGLDLCIDYEETQQPDAMLNKASVLSKVPGVKVSEVRDAAGLVPSTGDEAIDNTVLNMPGPNLDENGQGGFPDPNLPGEAGRPPLMQNTRRIGVAGRAGGNAGAVASKAIDDILAGMDVQIAAKAAMAPEAALAALDALEAAFEGKAAADPLKGRREAETGRLSTALAASVADAVHTLERGLLDAAEAKGETLYRRVKSSPAWDAFDAKLDALFDDAATAAMSAANIHQASLGTSPDTDMSDAKPDWDDELVNSTKDDVLAAVLKAQNSGSNADFVIRTSLAAVDFDKAAAKHVSNAYRTGVKQVSSANPSHNVFVPAKV